MLKKLALVLIIVGALNWGLIGFFGYDLISAFLGPDLTIVSRIIFSGIGLSGIYCIRFLFSNVSHRQDQ